MADWGAVEGGGHLVSGNNNPASSTGSALTISFTNTKGPWVELFAETPFNAVGILVSASTNASSLVHVLMDIGIGAAASEQVVLSNLHNCRLASANTHMIPIFIPIRIPAGVRLAARIQASATGVAYATTITLVGGGVNAVSSATRSATYGAVPATSRGTLVDPGLTAHTKGAWTEIAAATDFRTTGLIISALPDGSGSAGTPWLLDLAVGLAGSEQIVLSDVLIYGASSISTSACKFYVPLALPAGSRISARLQTSVTSTARNLSISIVALG